MMIPMTLVFILIVPAARVASNSNSYYFGSSKIFGLDTQLGYWFDDGKQASFGEWQKLAIARTFAKGADLVFLDEPNAALDAISDYEISRLYQKLFQDKMGIIIAHKFSHLIHQVDRILVLENGCLIETGTHQQLMEQKGVYHKMYQLQKEETPL